MNRIVRAPELDGGLAWLNVARPLQMRELRGHVVVLDFWTYCCVNCMHVLPVLRAIEEKFEDEPLIVIGVHSGKFSAEHDPARIRDAVGRYDVRHPVVVDDSMAIWGRYQIRSWPTLVVVRPDGTIAAVAPGEPKLEVLDAFLARELDLARKAGTLASGPLVLAGPAHDDRLTDALSYPGKVSILPGGRLAISDSGHHRVLVTTPDGEVELVVGSGLRGLADGAVSQAAFDDPQGTCWHDGALYIADTRNHAIRRVDVTAGVVTTVAGTGALGLTALVGRAPALTTALRSPWDLASVGDAIYVAMAGSHQLHRFFPATGEIEVYAGTGVEAMLDGRVGASAWAQPSGLSVRGNTLYVADSETSAVRAVDLLKGEVRTLVGEGLFDWGDEDGAAGEAMLQHGLGVAAIEGGVLVADTYNGKIRRITEGPAGVIEVRTVLGGLSEPGSIAVAADGAWIIADTNAHRVVRVVSGHAQPIPIRGAPAPLAGSSSAPTAHPRRDSMPSLSEVSTLSLRGWFTALLELPETAGLGPGDGVITLELEAAAGTELSEGAPIRVAVEVSRRSDLLLLMKDRFTVDAAGGTRQTVALDVTVTELSEPIIEAEILATVSYMVCHTGEQAVCTRGKVHARIPVRLLAEGGTSGLTLSVPLAPMEA